MVLRKAAKAAGIGASLDLASFNIVPKNSRLSNEGTVSSKIT